jgi:hypothetical protein
MVFFFVLFSEGLVVLGWGGVWIARGSSELSSFQRTPAVLREGFEGILQGTSQYAQIFTGVWRWAWREDLGAVNHRQAKRTVTWACKIVNTMRSPKNEIGHTSWSCHQRCTEFFWWIRKSEPLAVDLELGVVGEWNRGGCRCIRCRAVCIYLTTIDKKAVCA